MPDLAPLPKLDLAFEDIDSVKQACADFRKVFDRLRAQIEGGEGGDNLGTACEIAIAFIRYCQDLKRT